MWWLNGYNTDKMMAETLLNAAGELLPFVPCSTSFVFISYRINKANTEPLAGEESEGKSRTEEAEGKAIRALQGKNPGTQRKVVALPKQQEGQKEIVTLNT